jgi:hypothetical protein
MFSKLFFYSYMRNLPLCWLCFGLGLMLILAGCGAQPEAPPTRTPIPTYTPTPIVAQAGAVAAASEPTPTPAPPDTPTPTGEAVEAEPPTPVPATETPTPDPPTETPTATPTETSTPTVTPSPTVTPTATPSPTPDYAFRLETSEQFPSQVPGVDEVRIYLYVYSEDEYALEDYSLRVVKDNQSLVVQAKSAGGLPGETRPGPSPYTRFANLGAAFFEPAIGVWEVQLVDPDRVPAGPPVTFVLGENDPNQELYVRYKRKD